MSFIHRASNSHRRRLGGGYNDLVVGTGPIAYWPQNEPSGPTAHCLVNPAQNGTYTGVTLANDLTGPFDMPAPFFDGVNDYNNVQTAALAAAFNGDEGAFAIWIKVNAAGAWTDGTTRYSINGYVDIQNGVFLAKSSANNQLVFRYEAGAVTETITAAGVSSTGWMLLGQSWSKSADLVEASIDGVSAGTANTLGVWAGSLANAIIGVKDAVPTSPWHGWLGPAMYWDRPLSLSTFQSLALA